MKKIRMMLVVLLLGILSACSGNNDAPDDSDELASLDVDFQLPESADLEETVELKAIVTYGDEKVTDAEVEFEYWEKGDEENSTRIEAENNEDGTYTADVSFDRDGVFDIYAHTDAKGLHTMPLKSIMIGEGGDYDEEDAKTDSQEQTEGLSIDFTEPRQITAGEEALLTVQLQMDSEPYEGASVRYEIWQDESDDHEWVDAEEIDEGEYTGTHAFAEAGTYTVQIHVEDDGGLHEHEMHDIKVSE
ncbi:MAG TPA: FixH family protein [Bacillota bacterium]|nr:FixH family protein [Bacillota bacterium]